MMHLYSASFRSVCSYKLHNTMQGLWLDWRVELFTILQKIKKHRFAIAQRYVLAKYIKFPFNLVQYAFMQGTLKGGRKITICLLKNHLSTKFCTK